MFTARIEIHAPDGTSQVKQWREHVLARFDTDRISNGGTEAVNLIIEKTRRLAHGLQNVRALPT